MAVLCYQDLFNCLLILLRNINTFSFELAVLWPDQPFNPYTANFNNCRLLCHLLVILKVISANNVDPDQTAPLGEV